MLSISQPQHNSTSVGRKARPPLSRTTSPNTSLSSVVKNSSKGSMLDSRDTEGLMAQTPIDIVVHVDLPEETTHPDLIASVNFVRPPLPSKMLEPFDHSHSFHYPEWNDTDFEHPPEYKSWSHFAEVEASCFKRNTQDSGEPTFDFDRLGIPDDSLLFSIGQEELRVPASMTCDDNALSLIDIHTIPQELHRVLSSTTFEYNPVMRSLVFNIGMGMPLTALGFECWVLSLNETLSHHVPIVDVLISVDNGAGSMKGGDEADAAFLAVLWILSLIWSTNAGVQGLSLSLPPHLPISQTALNMILTHGLFNPRSGSSGNADDALEGLNLSTLSYSGSLSLLNTLIPASSMHSLQIMVIDDPQVSLDDVVILLKQAPKLCSLQVGTLTDCYPALLPVYQTIASRSTSPAPNLDWDSDDDAQTVDVGGEAHNAKSSTVTTGRLDSETLSAGNQLAHLNKLTDYPYLETLSLRYDASVCPVRLFENVRMRGLKSLLFVRVGAHDQDGDFGMGQ